MADDARTLVVADLRARGWDNVADDLRDRPARRRRKGPSIQDAYVTALDLAVHLRRAAAAGVEEGNAYEFTLTMARVLRRRLDEGHASARAPEGE
jgi:hypothetical protein